VLLGGVLVVALLGVFWLLTRPTAGVPEFSAVKAAWTPSEAFLLDRNGELLDQQRMDYAIRRFDWIPLEAVSPALTAAIVDGEDRRFWTHGGVDWRALLSAIRDQGVSQRRRGASTITMQVAALLEPSVRAGNSRGAWRRKLEQMRLARALESRWTKAQILEGYLNLLGYRGELQGIDATSRSLAGKAPSGLSVPESLVLAALLPAPQATPERVVSRACARAAARGVHVDCSAIRTAAGGMLNATSAAIAGTHDASAASLSHRSAPATSGAVRNVSTANNAATRGPGLAPHLARAVLRKPGEHVRTTLDARAQRLARDVLRRHLAGLAGRNVRDGAVLIVDNASGDVLAYVGSAGPASRASAVDGVMARRQAGSTLKPFLYELALERRYLTAASLLDDSPITLDTASGIYLPQNYDRDFKGRVSVRTALGSSLNVPAVRALVLAGVEPFRERLHALGYAGITQPGDFYGYALALGSAEVSLWEQVQAYRTLARGGRSAPLRTRLESEAVLGERGQPDSRTDRVSNEKPLLSADASFIVADMLSDRSARAVTFGLDNHLNTPFWAAVKTGTSKDMRDNWCIGFSSAFTVGVWVGNFEGDPMHDVSGVTGAAPVWQQIMLALHTALPSAAPSVPAGVTLSLARFTPAVEPARREWFLSTSEAAPISAQPSSTSASALSAGADETRIASVAAGGEIARISSPANGMVIAIDPDIPPALQRVPLAARGAAEGMVLRLNGSVLGDAQQNVLWQPTRGAHVLALEDSAGHTLDSARFTVR